MRSSRQAMACVVGAVVGAVAHAAFAACPCVTVEADAALRDQWPALEAQVRDAFAGRRDVDACARVRLTAGGPITAEVTLPDRRVASRTVSRPEDVVPALEALLLVPGAGEPSTAAGAPSAESAPSATAAPSALPVTAPMSQYGDVPARDRASPRAEPTRGAFGFELSAALTGRIGDGKQSVGLAAVSYAELARWLLGFEGRLDHYTSGSGDAEDAIELAALVGRRFDFASLALDVVGGPSLAFASSSRIAVAKSGMVPADSPNPPGRAQRLLLGTTVHFGGRSAFHTFAGLDADVGLGSVRASEEANLPAWAVGLALGATLGTPR